MPGKYKVNMAIVFDGKTTQLAGPAEFNVVAAGIEPMSAEDHALLMAFAEKAARLQAAIVAAVDVANNIQTEIGDVKRALIAAPSADESLTTTAVELQKRDEELQRKLIGDRVAGEHQEPEPPSILQRIGRVSGSVSDSTSKPTGTQQNDYKIAGDQFAAVQTSLHQLVDDTAKFEKQLDAAGIPHTPNRVPTWKDQ
jgi:hypothetical protein